MQKPTSPHAAEILGDLWEAVGIDPHELTQTGRAASDQARRIYQAAIASDSIIPSADEAAEHHEILDGARQRAVGRFIDLGRAYSAIAAVSNTTATAITAMLASLSETVSQTEAEITATTSAHAGQTPDGIIIALIRQGHTQAQAIADSILIPITELTAANDRVRARRADLPTEWPAPATPHATRILGALWEGPAAAYTAALEASDYPTVISAAQVLDQLTEHLHAAEAEISHTIALHELQRRAHDHVVTELIALAHDEAVTIAAQHLPPI